MRRVELLIDEVRMLTGNQRYDADSGVSQYQMVRSLKSAQVQLFQDIAAAKKNILLKTEAIDIVAGQEAYDLPRDIFLENVETLQWTNTPNTLQPSYINLSVCYNKDRQQANTGYPFGYLTNGDQFLLVPPVNTGELRMVYSKRVPDLEKRSGKVTAVTINGSHQVTAMTLNTAEASFDATYLNSLQALCVVDNYGAVKALNVPITSINSGSGVITLSAFTLEDDETIAVGDYVTAGFWTCNQSELPDVCEDHIIKGAVYLTRYGDASNWTKAAVDDMAMSLQRILSSFQSPTSDVIEIPITATDYLWVDGGR